MSKSQGHELCNLKMCQSTQKMFFVLFFHLCTKPIGCLTKYWLHSPCHCRVDADAWCKRVLRFVFNWIWFVFCCFYLICDFLFLQAFSFSLITCIWTSGCIFDKVKTSEPTAATGQLYNEPNLHESKHNRTNESTITEKPHFSLKIPNQNVLI